jgi:small-conductance mechanosensitive channel
MTLGWTETQWTELGITVFGVVAVVILIRVLSDLILRRLAGAIAGRTKTDLDDVLLQVSRLPLQLTLIAATIDAAHNGLSIVPAGWRSGLEDAFFVAYVVIAFLFLWRLITALTKWYGRQATQLTDSKLDEQLLPFFRRIALLGLLILMLIIVLDHFGVEVSGLVATLGVSSLVIGLAGQAALADTISGFVLMIDRPFRIGDRIEILELGTWGDVVDVGLRSARIRTLDNRLVIVPNSVLGKSLIVNHSFPDSHYRLDVHVGVAFGTDIKRARSAMIEAAGGVEGVWAEREVEALFLEMGDSALIFRIRVWIESYVDTRRIVDRVNTAVYRALNEVGIQVPFPQRTLHHRIDQVEPAHVRRLLEGRG